MFDGYRARAGAGAGARRWSLSVLAALIVHVLGVSVASAEEVVPPAARPEPVRVLGAGATGAARLTLAQALALAETNFPKIAEARARLAKKEGQLREAHTAPFSQFQVQGGVGIAPTVRGTTVYSPNSDAALTDNMALAWQVGIEGVVPLWTFGKISNLWSAAEANIKLGRHEVEKEKNAIRMEVRRAYFGLQLARDSRLLVGDAEKQLAEFVTKLEGELANGEGDEIDLLKAKMQRSELLARSSEAERGERIALAALRFFTGSQAPIDIVDEPLTRVNHVLGPLPRYLEAARMFRPEINMARSGILVREAQVKMERAKYLPDLGLGVSAKLGRAPEITDQRNPFGYDPANVSLFGAALVLRWKLDLLPQSARVAQATADLEEVRAIERFALGGVATEVERAYAEAEDASRRLEAWSDATRYAKQWLIKVQQGQDLGLFEGDELVEPAKEYALKKFSEMSALYDYNLAISALALATGWSGMLEGG